MRSNVFPLGFPKKPTAKKETWKCKDRRTNSQRTSEWHYQVKRGQMRQQWSTTNKERDKGRSTITQNRRQEHQKTNKNLGKTEERSMSQYSKIKTVTLTEREFIYLYMKRSA